VFGLLVAWVLVRYDFPWRKAIDAMVDLPFALADRRGGYCTDGYLRAERLDRAGFCKVWHSILRSRLPVLRLHLFLSACHLLCVLWSRFLRDLDPEMEEAAACLGATRLQVFTRIILPQVLPALMAGFAMAFARALGEYGSVIFIAGNMPYKSEIVPLIIVIKLEQYDYAGATAIALVMLIASFIMLLVINLLMKWSHIRRGGGMRS
jgi:sulfate transport system permease protein